MLHKKVFQKCLEYYLLSVCKKVPTYYISIIKILNNNYIIISSNISSQQYVFEGFKLFKNQSEQLFTLMCGTVAVTH